MQFSGDTFQDNPQDICNHHEEQDVQKTSQPVIAHPFDKDLKPGSGKQEGEQQRKRQQGIDRDIGNDKPFRMKNSGAGGQPFVDTVQDVKVQKDINGNYKK